MKKRLFFVASFIIGTIVFISVIAGIGLDNIMSIFRKVSVKYLLLFLLTSIVIHIGKTYKWHLIVKSHGVKIGFFRLMMCKFSGIAISFITPIAMMGGGVAMGYLLTKEKVESHKAVSSVVLDKSFEVMMSLVFTLFGLITILATSAIPGDTIFLLMIIPIMFIAIIYFMYDRISKRKGIFTSITKVLRLNRLHWFKKYDKMLSKSEDNVAEFLRENKKDSIIALAITAVVWCLMLLEYKFVFLSIGLDVGWAVVFSAIAVVGLTFSLPVPAALGILEGGQASLLSAVGMAAGAGVVLSLIIRVRDMLWTFIGLVYLAMKGLGLAKREPIND